MKHIIRSSEYYCYLLASPLKKCHFSFVLTNIKNNVFKHLTKRISNQKSSLITIYLPHLFTTTKFHCITISTSSSHFPQHHYITSPHHAKEEMRQPSPTSQVWPQHHCWLRHCCCNHIIEAQWTQS